MNMEDKIGLIVEPGDRVVFASGAQSDRSVRTGVVIDITLSGALIQADGGNKQQRRRRSGEIVSLRWIEPYRKSNPEEWV